MLLCVHIPAFILEVARREHPVIGCGEPALLADKRDRGHVIELNEQASLQGARPGQTIVQACAAAQDAHVLVHDAVRTHDAWQEMLDALDAISPLIDDAAEGTAFLEMRGIDGEPAQWIERTRAVLARFDLPVRVAFGPNKFVARAAARAGDGTMCEPEGIRALLAPMPLETLDLDCNTIDRLRLLGVTTLGELACLPHGPFVRRFGAQAARWHERARGIDCEPLRPRAHELQIDAAVYGEGSAAQEEQVYFALRVLADRVCSDLERTGRAAAMVCMTLQCENGDRRDVDVGFAQATADPKAMLDVMRAKLEGMTFEAPIDGLRLQALQLEEGGAPAALFAQSEPDPQTLGVALTRLRAALGVEAQCARVCPGHRLETRFRYQHFAPKPKPVGQKILQRSTPVPQLRLLPVREVRVTIARSAPCTVDARRVKECAGPWRVDDGWFDAPVARDEYDVLLDDGTLYRIFREGERWYLRGIYD